MICRIARFWSDGECILLLPCWWFGTKYSGTLVNTNDINCLINHWVKDWLWILRHDNMGITSSLTHKWSWWSDWLRLFGEIRPNAFIRFRHRLFVPAWGLLGGIVGWFIFSFRTSCCCYTSSLINIILNASLTGL